MPIYFSIIRKKSQLIKALHLCNCFRCIICNYNNGKSDQIKEKRKEKKNKINKTNTQNCKKRKWPVYFAQFYSSQIQSYILFFILMLFFWWLSRPNIPKFILLKSKFYAKIYIFFFFFFFFNKKFRNDQAWISLHTIKMNKKSVKFAKETITPRKHIYFTMLTSPVTL